MALAFEVNIWQIEPRIHRSQHGHLERVDPGLPAFLVDSIISISAGEVSRSLAVSATEAWFGCVSSYDLIVSPEWFMSFSKFFEMIWVKLPWYTTFFFFSRRSCLSLRHSCHLKSFPLTSCCANYAIFDLIHPCSPQGRLVGQVAISNLRSTP